MNELKERKKKGSWYKKSPQENYPPVVLEAFRPPRLKNVDPSSFQVEGLVLWSEKVKRVSSSTLFTPFATSCDVSHSVVEPMSSLGVYLTMASSL